MATSDRPVPENFHAMYDPGYRKMKGTEVVGALPRTAGHQKLAASRPDLAVDYDESTGLPIRVMSERASSRLSQAAASPEDAAVAFVRSHADLWNLSDGDLQTVKVVGISERGLKTVRLVQRLDGRDVFNSDVTVAVSEDNQVVSVTGQFFPAAGSASSRAAGAAQSATSPEEAIAKAASDLTGFAFAAADFRLEEPAGELWRKYHAPGPAESHGRPVFERPVRVKHVMFPIGNGQFVPGYFLELWIKTYPTFSYVVDSEGDPDILYRKNLTSGLKFKYRVHNTGDALFRPEDGPAPGTPHPTGNPNGFQAPHVVPKLIELESLLPGRPWLPDGATSTRGNNCFAYADLKTGDGFNTGDVTGKVSAPHTFDYVYDDTKPASDTTNLQASLVGMFFHVNWLHDRWYEAGFDEAAGAGQEDDFGLGSGGGDPVLAEGNDFSGTDNANMSTPPRGSSPRMQMFEFKGPEDEHPSRTSNLEALITFHEMGHYITNRLVGDASGLGNLQGGAMGEGWGDFFAICMTSQATDRFTNGTFAAGGWTDITPTFKENYYFSIRRYPYSTDLAKNPLTFKHISAGVILPPGPKRNPRAGGGNNEVHNAGEVWCCALWEVFVNLVSKHGHADAEKRALLYVIGGLKQTPTHPTFTQARDGIITAVSALHPEDLPEVWQGFAKRGLGAGAQSPPAFSTTLAGVVESFATP